MEPGNIQIALFDDRLEATSPGMLLNSVSITKMLEGYSKIRNRAIANALSYMKIIEKWGSSALMMCGGGAVYETLLRFAGEKGARG